MTTYVFSADEPCWTKFEAPLPPFDKLLDEEVIRFEGSSDRDWLLTYTAGACVLQFVNFLRRAASAALLEFLL